MSTLPTSFANQEALFVDIPLSPIRGSQAGSTSSEGSYVKIPSPSRGRARHVTFSQQLNTTLLHPMRRRPVSLPCIAELEHAKFLAAAAHHTPPIYQNPFDSFDHQIDDNDAQSTSPHSDAASSCSSDSYSLASDLERGDIPWDAYAQEFRDLSTSAWQRFSQNDVDGPFDLQRAGRLSRCLTTHALSMVANSGLNKPLPTIYMKPLPPLPDFEPLSSPALSVQICRGKSPKKAGQCPYTADTLSASPVWGALPFRQGATSSLCHSAASRSEHSVSPTLSSASGSSLQSRRQCVPELTVEIPPVLVLEPIQVFRTSPSMVYITPRSPPPAYTRFQKGGDSIDGGEHDEFESLQMVWGRGKADVNGRNKKSGWGAWLGEIVRDFFFHDDE